MYAANGSKKFAQRSRSVSSDDDEQRRGGNQQQSWINNIRPPKIHGKGFFVKNYFVNHLEIKILEKWSENAAKRIYNVLRDHPSSGRNAKELLQNVRNVSGDDLQIGAIEKLLRNSDVDEWISHGAGSGSEQASS